MDLFEPHGLENISSVWRLVFILNLFRIHDLPRNNESCNMVSHVWLNYDVLLVTFICKN